MSPRDAVELQQIERIQDRIACVAPAVTADEARRIAINVAKLQGAVEDGIASFSPPQSRQARANGRRQV